MRLLPQNAEERMRNRNDSFEEMIDKFTKEDWKNIEKFTKAIRYKKQVLLKGMKQNANDHEKELMYIKKHIGYFFRDLFIAIGIDMVTLKKHKEPLVHVIKIFSRKLVEFLYETYENRVSIRLLETLHDKFGFDKVELEKNFTELEIRDLEIQLITTTGTIIIIINNTYYNSKLPLLFFNRNRRLDVHEVYR